MNQLDLFPSKPRHHGGRIDGKRLGPIREIFDALPIGIEITQLEIDSLLRTKGIIRFNLSTCISDLRTKNKYPISEAIDHGLNANGARVYGYKRIA
jgi:hypothetical protein